MYSTQNNIKVSEIKLFEWELPVNIKPAVPAKNLKRRNLIKMQ